MSSFTKNFPKIRFQHWLYFISFCIIISWISCSDSTIVGTELFEDESLKIEFSDQFDLETTTISVDSVLVYSNTEFAPPSFLLGGFMDPIFGSSSASIYSQVFLDISQPDFSLNDHIDSLVLVLALDPDAKYGDTTANYQFKVFEVLEPMTIESELYSNKTYEVADEEIGLKNNYTLSYDSVEVFSPATGELVTEKPQVRIPFNQSFIEDNHALLVKMASNSDLRIILEGIEITSENVSNSMLSVLVTASQLETNIAIYYTKEDGTKDVYNLPLTGVRMNRFVHDNTNAPVTSFYDDPVKGDSLIFVQALAGPNVKIDLSSVLELNDVLINHAEIELTLAEIPGDQTDLFQPINNLKLNYIDEDENPVLIRDFSLGVQSNDILNYFGGSLQENNESGTSLKTYKLNITSHIKDVLRYDLKPEVYLSSFNTVLNPGRSIIFGPGNSTNPMKVNVVYTIPE